VHLCLYPFLSAASKYVEESGITLDNLIHTGTFRYARSRGKERIIEAIKDGKVRKPVIISNTQAETELLIFEIKGGNW